MKEVWESMGTFTGCKKKNRSTVDGVVVRSTEFNYFLNRFDSPAAPPAAFCSMKKRDAARLDSLVRRAGSVVGTELESLISVAEKKGPETYCWTSWTVQTIPCTEH
ncbi:unnamed protein product [Pleuronectes platessa]|uniref:Uncharacterized protein n=1 Tax=Pleuronectes platessa TaxID=8262 RepID=A0A9N7VXS2_PLEPL|nr:unnamed protein product [Pleuronectes platessa]